MYSPYDTDPALSENPDQQSWFDQNAPASTTANSNVTNLAAGNGMTKTGTPIGGRPTGIPDPAHPGYDTGGYILGSKVNADGTISIPGQGDTTSRVDPTTNQVTQVPNPPAPPDPYPNAASLAALYGPMPNVPTIPAFAPPSAQSVLENDPGFIFREQQGEQALTNNAAARGVANTGGALKDLLAFNQNYASGEYGNAFDRALNTYGTNFATQYQFPYNNLWAQYLQGVANFNTNQAQRVSTAPPV